MNFFFFVLSMLHLKTKHGSNIQHTVFTAVKEEVYFQGNFGISVQIKVKFCNPVLFAAQIFHSLQCCIHKVDICLLIFKLRGLGMECWPFSILDKRSAHLGHHSLKKNAYPSSEQRQTIVPCITACIIFLSQFRLS